MPICVRNDIKYSKMEPPPDPSVQPNGVMKNPPKVRITFPHKTDAFKMGFLSLRLLPAKVSGAGVEATDTSTTEKYYDDLYDSWLAATRHLHGWFMPVVCNDLEFQNRTGFSALVARRSVIGDSSFASEAPAESAVTMSDDGGPPQMVVSFAQLKFGLGLAGFSTQLGVYKNGQPWMSRKGQLQTAFTADSFSAVRIPKKVPPSL